MSQERRDEAQRRRVCACCFKPHATVGRPADVGETAVVCKHCNLLDDDASGDCVCTDCGLVLDRTYVCGGRQSVEKDVWLRCAQDTFGERPVDGDWFEFIRRVCANQPWLDDLAQDSVDYFVALLRDARTLTIRRQDLAAFAIYRTARGAGSAMLPKLAASALGSDAKQLLRLEQLFPDQVVADDAEFHLASVSADFDLTRRDLVEIRAQVLAKLNGECFGRQPRTVAAAAVFVYVRHLRRPSCLRLSESATLAILCKNISARSVRQAAAQICSVLNTV